MESAMAKSRRLSSSSTLLASTFIRRTVPTICMCENVYGPGRWSIKTIKYLN